MKKHHLNILVVIVFVLSILSCSSYNKILKGSDYNLKYTTAIEYYEKGECYKALPLFEELMSYFRMTDKGENVYYYYAKTQHCMKDYYMAAYYFKRFTKNFPNSSRAEECAFSAAICNLESSPEYYLDQSDTYDAIDEFQLFINRYPSSNLIDSCNVLIKDLRSKLELKSYEKAKLYYKMNKFRSAIIAFNITLQQFPDTKHREDILFMILKSKFIYASNSINSKKHERFEETIVSYHKFADSFSNSNYMNTAENYYNTCLKEIEKLNTNNNGI